MGWVSIGFKYLRTKNLVYWSRKMVKRMMAIYVIFAPIEIFLQSKYKVSWGNIQEKL